MARSDSVKIYIYGKDESDFFARGQMPTWGGVDVKNTRLALIASRPVAQGRPVISGGVQFGGNHKLGSRTPPSSRCPAGQTTDSFAAHILYTSCQVITPSSMFGPYQLL